MTQQDTPSVRVIEKPSPINVNGPQPSEETTIHLPSDCWRPVFDDYREAVEGVTEAADEHHFFALMAVIGAIMGRRVFFHYSYPLFPNFYVLNIGPSGSTKKTSAIRLAVSVADLSDPSLTTRWTVGSGEGLLEALSRADTSEEQAVNPVHHRLLLVQGELGQLLGKAQQEGSGTLIPILLEAFDCPPLINPPTRTKPITAHKPTLSIVSATTPIHLQKYLRYEDVYGGLGSRLLISIGVPKAPIPLPRKMEPGRLNLVVEAVRGALVRWAAPTEFTMTPEATKRWERAYITWKGREKTLGPSADIVSRTHVYALKMALVLAALENDSPVIEVGQVEAGIMAADFAHECALMLLGEFGDSKSVRLEGRIMRKVQKEPGITRREVQQFLGGGCDSMTFKRLVDAMLETEKLREVEGCLGVG